MIAIKLKKKKKKKSLISQIPDSSHYTRYLTWYWRGTEPQTKFEHVFYAISNYQHFLLTNNVVILKQIVWEIQEWITLQFHGPGSFWAFDQNGQNISFCSITQKPLGLLKFQCHVLSFSDNLLQDVFFFFFKKCW